MIVHNNINYHTTDIKSKVSKMKPGINAASKPILKDTYETSSPDLHGESSLSGARETLLKTVKKRVDSGYYNSRDVLEDLSNSFAKVLNQTIS